MFKSALMSVGSLVKGVSSLSIRGYSSVLANKPITKSLLSSNGSQLNKSVSLVPQNLKTSLFLMPKPDTIQVRHGWGYKDRMMLKDIKRRELLKKFAPERVRLQALRANTVLPKVLKRSAAEQLQSITKHSTLGYITNRCSITSKAGGCLHKWRISRHIWRMLADYNQMSGVTRARWGVPTRDSAIFTFRKQKKSWFNYDGWRMISYTDRRGDSKKQRFQV